MLIKNKVLAALSLGFFMILSGHAVSQNNQWQAPKNGVLPYYPSHTQYMTPNNNPYYSQSYTPYYYPYQQNFNFPQHNRNQANGSGLQSWQNWFKNQFQNGNWQQGDGNVFQDAKGFYKLMGNGRTKWKFYFDVDFQAEMDAWMKGNGQAKNQQRDQWTGNAQQQLNRAGQANWNQQHWYNNQYNPNARYYPSYTR